MHYQPTPFKTEIDKNPPKNVASARAALFALLRDHPLDPEPRTRTEAVPVVRPRISEPKPEPTERSKWYSALLEEDNFVFCTAT